MKIGILNAYPAGEDKIDWKDGPVDVYIDFLELAGPSFQYAGYHVAQGQFPQSPQECDAYLITGSPRGTYDSDEWIVRLADFVRTAFEAGQKLVGICFGHQVLAHALGGQSVKSEKGWGLGWKSFEITGEKPWMIGRPENCSLYFVHQDQVVRLPPNAERLGGSEFCPNTFFAIGDQVLGIQGHPEFTEEFMGDIFRALEGTVDPEVFASAVSSMNNRKPDNSLFAQWIVNFLQMG